MKNVEASGGPPATPVHADHLLEPLAKTERHLYIMGTLSERSRRARRARNISLLALVGIVSFMLAVACAPAARVTGPTKGRSTPTPGPISPTATVSTISSPTAQPTSPPTSLVRGVMIELIGLGPQHVIIQPGQTGTMAVGNGEIDVLVHYPVSPYPRSGPYPFSLTVDPLAWKPVIGSPGLPNTLTLHLFGSKTGLVMVTIGHVPNNPSIRFGLEITPNPVTPTLAPTNAAPTSPVAANLRPCSSADLAAGWGGSDGLTNGQIEAWLAFGNRSSPPCTVQGIPHVELLTLGGQAIPITVNPCTTDRGTAILCRPETPVVLLPGTGQIQPHHLHTGQAAVALFWQVRDGTGHCPTPPPGSAVTIRLTMPGTGDRLDVTVPGDEATSLAYATCGGRLAVFAFQAVH